MQWPTMEMRASACVSMGATPPKRISCSSSVTEDSRRRCWPYTASTHRSRRTSVFSVAAMTMAILNRGSSSVIDKCVLFRVGGPMKAIRLRLLASLRRRGGSRFSSCKETDLQRILSLHTYTYLLTPLKLHHLQPQPKTYDNTFLFPYLSCLNLSPAHSKVVYFLYLIISTAFAWSSDLDSPAHPLLNGCLLQFVSTSGCQIPSWDLYQIRECTYHRFYCAELAPTKQRSQ